MTAALLRAPTPHPDQLDALLRITPPLTRPALWLLLGTLLLALGWGAVARAPVRAEAQGVLISPGGVTDAVPATSGRVLALHVALGETVTAGQLLATIDQPDLRADLARHKLQRAKLQERADWIRAFLDESKAAGDRLDGIRRAGLRRRIEALAALAPTMQSMLAGQERLMARGLATQDRLLALRHDIEQSRANQSEAESQLANLDTERDADSVKARRELLDVSMTIAATDRDIGWTEAELARRGALRAPVAGRVIDMAVNPGEMARTDAPVLRIASGAADGLVAVLYVAPRGTRPVRVGMLVQVVPATVRVLRDGYVEGVVTAVAPTAATPESMQRLLKNATLVKQLTDDGAPVEVIVRLTPDAAAPSGYRWSGGAGPALRLSEGTAVEGRIVTDRIPLLAMLLPQADKLLVWLGL